MDKEQYNKLVTNLCNFVERASKKEATPDEIAVLPEVAKILFSLPSRPSSLS